MRNEYKVLEPKGIKPFGKPRCNLRYNIKTDSDIRAIECRILKFSLAEECLK
jgi:hypothetical protein